MEDKHYELLLIKHIWILLDSYVVQTNVHKMNKAEQRAFRWLVGTVIAYGPKEEIMKTEFASESNQEDNSD